MAGKAPSPAQGLISTLHGRGWTDAAIGRALGRDSSLIHQGATGKKPLNNLVGALGEIVNSGANGPRSARAASAVQVTPPPRRTRASGQPAQVRLSRAEREARGPTGKATRRPRGHFTAAERSKAKRLPNGQTLLTGDSVRSARLAADIADGMSGNARVKVSYLGKDGKWHTLGSKGGIAPETLKDQLKGRRDWVAALNELIGIYYPAKGGGGADWGADPSGAAEFYVVGLGNA